MSLGRVGISGLGLMGGSMALALARRAPGPLLYGHDPDPGARELAVASGAFERVVETLPELLGELEVLVLAAPVSAILSSLAVVAKAPPPLVMDLGSTKVRVCQRAVDVGLAGRFVGGHPLAGAESRGFASADPLLYEGATFVLCGPEDIGSQAAGNRAGSGPAAPAGSTAVAAARELVASVGARPFHLEPEAHDRILACTSHLPQLVAVALANTVAELELEYPESLSLVGGGFRDLTRIASSPYAMWAPVLETNREAIQLAVQGLERHLEGVLSPGLAEGAFARAAQLRSQVPLSKGLLQRGFEVVVHMADSPGALAGVCVAVAEEGLSIQDVELLRIKEGEWGSFRLAFRSEAERARAIAALERAGYQARPRE